MITVVSEEELLACGRGLRKGELMVDICWLLAFPIITASEEKQDWLKETELPLSGHLSSSHHERDVSLLLGLF